MNSYEGRYLPGRPSSKEPWRLDAGGGGGVRESLHTFILLETSANMKKAAFDMFSQLTQSVSGEFLYRLWGLILSKLLLWWPPQLNPHWFCRQPSQFSAIKRTLWCSLSSARRWWSLDVLDRWDLCLHWWPRFGSFSPQTTAIVPVGFVHAGVMWCFASPKLYFLLSLSRYQVSWSDTKGNLSIFQRGLQD